MVQAGNTVKEILLRLSTQTGVDLSTSIDTIEENLVFSTEFFMELTDSELKDMGLKLGVIKSIRKEIQKLSESSAAASS